MKIVERFCAELGRTITASIVSDTGTWLLLASCAAEAVAKPIPRFHVPALLPCFARTRKNTKALQACSVSFFPLLF